MNCRVCGADELSLVIDLGMQPWCNDFLTKEQVGSEPFYPLKVVYCHKCATSQLDYTVKKEVMFGDHTYLSGVTQSLSNHFRDIATYVDKNFGHAVERRNILDIGSNDGTQLKHYKQLGWDILGVEPSVTTAKMANDAGLNTLNRFFNKECMDDINKKFSVINAAGVFFHLEELHSVTDGIKSGLSENGVFVVQFLYMKQIMANCAFDQIYHEHLLYYNLRTLQALLAQYDLAPFDAFLSPIHGGQMICFVGHKGARKPTDRLTKLLKAEDDEGANSIEAYKRFSKEIALMKERNLEYLLAARQKGKRIFGMGAPAKGNTLLNYFGIGVETIECLLERNVLRRGLYAPGSAIPIRIENETEERADIYYVLAWNFKREILANNQHLVDAGSEFCFPVQVEG